MFHNFANLVLRFLFWLLVDWDFQGLEKVPREGPLIIVGNHVCFLDPLIMGACLGRKVILLSKVENFSQPVIGAWMRWYECIPVRRGEVDRLALRRSLEALRKGLALGVFPEGTRSRTGGLLQGRSGMVVLALWSGAPILPVGFINTDKVIARLKRLRRTRVQVQVGKPFTINAPQGKLTRQELRDATQEVMYQIAELLPPQYRGVYADLSRRSSRFLRLASPSLA